MPKITLNRVTAAIVISVLILFLTLMASTYRDSQITRRAEQSFAVPLDAPFAVIDVPDGDTYTIRLECAAMRCEMGFVIFERCWATSDNPILEGKAYFDTWPYPHLKRPCELP